MRTFLSTHWKAIVALVILVLLAIFTMSPGAATPELSARLRTHVEAFASGEHNTASPAALERAARYIGNELARQGYRVRRQEYRADGVAARRIEVSLANVAADVRPARIFIVGAHYDPAPGANDNGSGTAAVLELARLLSSMHPSQGTEIKFVFFVHEEPPRFMGAAMGSMRPAQALHHDGHNAEGARGNFIAFLGSREPSSVVAQALAAFRAGSDFPAEGLAAAAYVQGVTLSGHSAGQPNGYPALMITVTAFLHYPYYHTAADTADKLDYAAMARAVAGMSQTIAALAGTTAG